MKKTYVGELDDLLCEIFDKDDEFLENNDFEDLVYERFGVDVGQFESIAEALLDYVTPVRSSLGGEVYKAFSVKDNNSYRMLYRKRVKGGEK